MTALAVLALLAPADPAVEVHTHVVGRVTDPAGKPIVGATVWWQGPTPRGVASPTGSRTTTDKDGRFRVPVIVTDTDKTSGERYLNGTGFDVSADGFVRFQERLRVEERVVADPAVDTARDFVLAPGELIEGTVEVKAFEGFSSQITVRGPSFRQVYWVGDDGNFRFWVPKGTYTLSVLDAVSVGMNSMRRELHYAAGSAKKPVVVAGVAAGGPKLTVRE
ncbi:MAG: carboxypeptidase-like regulatory domain-containing protein [Gemmataceae bacterium]|nr:carboxypeptidase-like regulatory domain-containing protein [Gemmataceae bacterium]